MKRKNYSRQLLFAVIIFVLTINSFASQVAQAKDKLDTPKNFSGTALNTSEFETVLTITWDEVNTADGYEVYYRSDVPGEDAWGDWELVSRTNERTAQGSIIDGVFQMRVRAYKGSSYSDYTDVITVLGGDGIMSTPKIQLNEIKNSIYVKSTFHLKLFNATDPITWKSSDSRIASVSDKGIVKGIKKGSATITATSNGVNYSCKISVKVLSKKDQAITAYKKFLLSKLEKDSDYSDYYYAFDDMTGDGIPELFVGSSKGYWGTYSERYFLYTYKNNKVVALFTMSEHEGTLAVTYDRSKHYFIVEGPPTPTQYVTIYQYQSGKLKKIITSDDYTKYDKYSKNAKLPDYVRISAEGLK